MGEKELLDFYRNQIDELHRTNDKYKDKVDKHLRELVADRHELEAENLRRGEKISDLQKALVDLQLSCFEERERFLHVSAENDRLKKNEESLHENIRHLLNVTKEKDLRDRIIYILQDPKVEIGYRYNKSGTSTSVFKHKKSSDEFLKEQIQNLQAKLQEHSKISQNKSDVILEDCKVVLEKSRKKLLQYQEEIETLQNKLQEAEAYLSKTTNKSSTKGEIPIGSKSSLSMDRTSSSTYLRNHRKDSKPSDQITSTATDIHLSLVLLSQILTKVLSLLHNIQSSQVYAQAAKLSKSKSSNQHYVNETDINQLQSYIRQSTCLSYDVSNFCKSLRKMLSSRELRCKELDLDWELKELEAAVEDLAVATAEADLLTISLSRSTFFDYLKGPKPSFEKFGVKEMNNCSKYIAEMNKMVAYLKSSSDYVVKATKFTERIQKCVAESSYESLSLFNQNKVDSGTSVSGSSVSDELSHLKQDKLGKKFRRSRVQNDDLTKRIDKTLAKINHIESGEYFKDDEFCKHLGEQVGELTEKLKELYDEFNVQNLHDQFSEYSSLTLSKLETIAKQSRDAVIAAEAQISAHRSNARNLSQKLRDTEDLLRESIHECLSLKQKLHHESIQRETDKVKFCEELQEKLHRVADIDDLETAVKEVVSSIQPTEGPKKPVGPFECMYCKQGSGHKLCDEKIKEMRASNRKLTTELKLLKQDMKEEKKISKMSQDQADKANRESASQSENLRTTFQALESKNASLLEKLQVERNRLKNMERFRRLEVEGFHTDIKNFKNKIQDLEKQLMKAVLIFEHDKRDQELLKAVHTTAQNSKQAVGAIKRLKAKLYELETDLKHL